MQLTSSVKTMSMLVVVLLLVAALVLLISMTVFLHYHGLSNSCARNPNIWCWTDWTCKAPTGNTYPAQETYGCQKGVVRDVHYCDIGTNPGCECMANPDGSLKPECTCLWSGGGLPATMQEYCNNNSQG